MCYLVFGMIRLDRTGCTIFDIYYIRLTVHDRTNCTVFDIY